METDLFGAPVNPVHLFQAQRRITARIRFDGRFSPLSSAPNPTYVLAFFRGGRRVAFFMQSAVKFPPILEP